MANCSGCGVEHYRKNQRYCLACHAATMRSWRKNHPGAYDHVKDNARSYANSYKRRGKLIPEACACGSEIVEMHHPDYSNPLAVIWMCRPCHLEHHVSER